MFKSTMVAAALAIALVSGMAQAVNIVDTGTPSDDVANGWQFNKNQFFAGEFSLLNDSFIDTIQGYFSTADGVVGISLFEDDGSIPGAVKFSTNLITTDGVLAWNGVSGLNWALAAGTYWVGFSPDYTSTSITTVMQGGAPSPLAAYAQDQGSGWQQPVDYLALGLRIEATAAAPVPEPASIAMYALGLSGLAVAARRKKS